MTSLSEDDPMDGSMAGAEPDKPYHSKRPHRKSRLGCKNCKTRKVKCDEGRPRCRACALRKETCVYPSAPHPRPASASTASSGRAGSLASPETPLQVSRSSSEDSDMALVIVDEPLFTYGGKDVIDMQLLWFYTAKGFDSFAIDARLDPAVDTILRVKIPEHAFTQTFLMDCLLGLSASQMRLVGQDIPESKAITYRARAFEGYRRAVEKADPESFPALLACSLLLCGLSSQMFREPDAKPLYIIDWMTVWKGIGLIVEMITPQKLHESGMAPIFVRPAIDLNETAKHIPGNLLFMVSSIKPGDEDYPYVDTYYETLKYLGALYKELSRGFSDILNLRVITWFTFLPRQFVQLARQKRPRTLIIIAHYLIFARICDEVWWMKGVGDRDLGHIVQMLGSEWDHALRVPRAAVPYSSEYKAELAMLLLEDESWQPRRVQDYYIVRKDYNAKTVALVDDSGQKVEYDETGFHKLKAAPDSPASPATFDRVQLITQGTPVFSAGLDTIDPESGLPHGSGFPPPPPPPAGG